MRESDIYKSLGVLVRQHRKRLGINQGGLAAQIGLSRASIANIETGRQRIPLHHLYQLAQALKIDVYALLPKPVSKSATSVDRKVDSTMGLSDQQRTDIKSIVGSLGINDDRETK